MDRDTEAGKGEWTARQWAILRLLAQDRKLGLASREEDRERRGLRQAGLIAYVGQPKRWQISAAGVAAIAACNTRTPATEPAGDTPRSAPAEVEVADRRARYLTALRLKWNRSELMHTYDDIETLRREIAQPTESPLNQSLLAVLDAIELADCEWDGLVASSKSVEQSEVSRLREENRVLRKALYRIGDRDGEFSRSGNFAEAEHALRAIKSLARKATKSLGAEVAALNGSAS